MLILATTLISLLCLFVLVTAWIAAGQIISPPRRTLQDYHQDILRQPEGRGISIQSSLSPTTQCPYLLIEPSSKISERGKTIRKQLDQSLLQPFGKITGNIVLLHGRKGRKEDLLPVAERFCAIGFRCIIIDLPGHGEHPSPYTYYGAHPDDGLIADRVLSEAAVQFNFNKQPAYLWGMSMGGAYANKALLDTGDTWKRSIIVCSFHSLPAVIEGKISTLPTAVRIPYSKLIYSFVKLRSDFDINQSTPNKWASSINTPVMLTHGTADNLISLDQGKALFNSYSSQKKHWVEVPDAGHDNILITSMPLYSKMAKWLLES